MAGLWLFCSRKPAMYRNEENRMKNRHPGKNISALIGPVCIILGVACLLAAGGLMLLNYRSEKALTETILRMTDSSRELAEEEETATGSADESRLQGEEGSGVQALGIMEIPAIGMKAPIVEGADHTALKHSLGHLAQTASPGADTGNCVIAGHRNYAFGRLFNRLDELEIGDIIRITDVLGNSFEYTVADIQVVEPEDISVLEDTEEPVLTLVTCTPVFIASHRLIVTCTRNTPEG